MLKQEIKDTYLQAMYDGFVADVRVQSKIAKDQDQVAQAIRMVEKIVGKLVGQR